MNLAPTLTDLLHRLSRELADAQRPVRILRALAWPDSVAAEFFAQRATRLPQPVYEPPRFDVATTSARLRDIAVRASGEHEALSLIRDTAESYATAAEMMGAVGTARFSALSRELYGSASSVSCDGKTSNLVLARHFDRVAARYPVLDLGHEDEELLPSELARTLDQRFSRFFHPHPIRVELVDSLAANAVAGADGVKIKASGRFTRRDLVQLEQHEGHVHVATTLNGRAQPVLSFLGSGAPRTTRTQEGLAVFTEFLSGSMDLERVRRLADRTLAIQMAEDGASFIDLYRWFLDRGYDPGAAFDSARRVCRGGLPAGGAPFTKDVVYLDGLVRVTNFLRAVLTRGHVDFVAVLFAGKLDLSDVPVLYHLSRAGVLHPPRFLPAWAKDPRSLTAFMSFAAFLDQTDLDATRAFYVDLIQRAELAFEGSGRTSDALTAPPAPDG